MAHALGADGDGVVITQVVPDHDGETPAARAYREALAALQPAPQPNANSFEGYAAARVLLEALRASEGPLARERVIDDLEALGQFDIGLGMPLYLDAERHQASSVVWPSIIWEGKVRFVSWRELVLTMKVAHHGQD